MGRGRGSNTKLLPDGREFCVALISTHVMADLIQVQGDVLVLYVYQLRVDANGIETVGVEKVSFRKSNGGAS